MGSEAKEMKYRRRARAPEPVDYGQCGGDRGGGAVDWAALKRQDPAELLRQLDEIRAQITRSCEIAGPAPPPPQRVARRAVSMRRSHADPPPPPPPLPEYHRSRHAGRYGHGLPPSSYDQRSVCDERYGKQPSGSFRQPQPQPRPEGQWEGYGYGGQGQGSCHQSSCQCAQCVHGQRAVPAQEENIPMARFLAGQQRPSYLFDRSSSMISFLQKKKKKMSSEYDRRSVASSLYSHLSMSKRRVEYFRKKAENFCRPVKGGAPFVVCSSCNQLLQLPPGKCTARRQNQVQCGSCSEVVRFKLKGVKVHPLVPPSSFAVPKSVRSYDRRNRQSFGWYPEQDDDTSSFGSHRQKLDFSDNLSRSSTGSYGSTDKERVSNKSSQLKPVSTRRSRFADSPKDILCQGDAESQAEAPAVRTISPQALIIEDKLVDPFSSQLKVCSGWDQIKSKRYGLNCKGDYDVRGESKSEQKSKESHQDGFGEETINRAYGQKFKQSNADWHDGHVGNKNMKKANSDDSSSLEDEAMSKKYEEKSKQDDTFEVQGVSKRYGNCNKNGYNDALEVDSITKKSEEEKGKDDCAKSLSSNCENTKIVAKNELSVNEQRDTSSRFSSEAGLDEFQSPAGKSGDSSFFGGLLKKGFKDLSLFNQSMDNVKVSINGHSISERALRRAEKKAGPVGPGSYWYDQRAGFWGVMGHECSGIIPPLIREFSYSMPKDCAGGNTGVLVNGRELHQKDFDLLVKRGLQRFTGKSYTVDISGNVIDDTTNQKLRNLGKLAPTIEKMKRGFGMHTPEETS